MLIFRSALFHLLPINLSLQSQYSSQRTCQLINHHFRLAIGNRLLPAVTLIGPLKLTASRLWNVNFYSKQYFYSCYLKEITKRFSILIYFYTFSLPIFNVCKLWIHIYFPLQYLGVLLIKDKLIISF